MEKRAAAFAQYNEAAVLQMLVEVLPQVAREVAAPMAAIDKLTVVSTDGAGALPKQVTNNLVQTMELLKQRQVCPRQTHRHPAERNPHRI